MRACTKCKSDKDPADFPRDSRNKSGLSSWCKDCHRKRSQEKEVGPGYREKRAAKMRVKRAEPGYREKERKRREKYREAKRGYDAKFRATPAGRARSLWNAARRRAESRGEPFALSVERIESALKMGVCEYTGVAFEYSGGRTPGSPSVDRKDPFKPYSDDNVSVVCDWYNMAKGRLSNGELIENCKRLLVAAGYEVK